MRYTRIGAILFILWGVLHLVAGLSGAVAFAISGPAGVFTGFGGALVTGDISPTLDLAAHIALDFSLILAGYGVLAIWAAALIWRGERLGFWLNTAMLGIADMAFIVALVVPGFITVAAASAGPVLYVLGVGFSAVGFFARLTASPDSRSSAGRSLASSR